MKEPDMFQFHNYETEKITHKASDVAENLHVCLIFFGCLHFLQNFSH